MSVLPKPTTSPIRTPPRLLRWCAAIFDGGDLVIEQAIAELGRNAELGQAGARLLRQVVGHLDVDVVRRERRLARPAFLDDLHQLGGDVDAPAVVPAIFEPFGELVGGVVVEHVHVEFALIRQAGEREIAAAEIADDRVDRVGPEAAGKAWREACGGETV